MARECYFISGSPWAWRVLLALQHKGLEFTAKELHFSKGDNQSPAFLALNPRGQVPVLVDGDLVIRESGAIIAYLDRAYPEKPLLGATAAEAALIWQRMLEAENNLMASSIKIFRPLFRGQVAEKKAEMDEALAKIPDELAIIEKWLSESDWVAGKSVSAADYTLYTVAAMFQRVGTGPLGAQIDTSAILPFSTTAPKLAAWMKRVEALPGFDAVYPPHWKAAA